MKKSIGRYTDEYINDYGFEAEMVRYRSELVQERLRKFSPRKVVELGCGVNLQARKYYDLGGRWDEWVIVEPSETFAKFARDSGLPDINVIEAFFEDVTNQIPESPDLILCSGLLHEVPDSDQLLTSIRDNMSSKTRAHINVPNARSLHRQLAHAMGLIDDLTTLSQRNTALQQPRVYDQGSLTAQVAKHGLSVVASGGHLVKPFTHAQMAPLVDALGRDVMDGLFRLGQSNPEFASEIYVEVIRK
jgi:trans-aconitate methyltransferase